MLCCYAVLDPEKWSEFYSERRVRKIDWDKDDFPFFMYTFFVASTPLFFMTLINSLLCASCFLLLLLLLLLGLVLLLLPLVTAMLLCYCVDEMRWVLVLNKFSGLD